MPDVSRRDAARLLALGMGAGLIRPEGVLAAPGSTVDAPSPTSRRVVDVIGREGWGARPSAGLFHPHSLRRMTVHHSVSYAGSASGAPERIRGYQKLHQGPRGWADIAYHYLIDPAGNVYEGRPPSVAGDTATTYDPAGHFLVCLDGDFDRQAPTEPQIYSLVTVLSWAAATYGLLPWEITGHRDWANTGCPGRRLADRLVEIQASVVEVLATRRPSVRHLNPEESNARVADVVAATGRRRVQ